MWGKVLGEISEENNVDLINHPFKWKLSDVGMEEEYRRTAPLRAPLVWARNRFWRVWRYMQYLSPAGIRPLFEWYKPQRTWARNRSTLAVKIAAANNVSVIVDASKDPLDMLDVYENAELPVKMIHLTRDSRGNIWSMMKRMKDSDDRKEIVARAADDWAKVNRRIWRFVQRVPERDYRHIHYEELCRDPQNVMAQLFEFVGLEPHDVLAATETTEGESDQGHTIGGNKIRFTSEKLTIREDKVWQEKLTEQDLKIIDEVAGPMSRQLGYKH